MADQLFTICYQDKFGIHFLSGIESHCYGERFLGYFDHKKSCALPMTLDQADKICSNLRNSLPTHGLDVVPVPWPLPAKEVHGNE